MMRKSYAPRRDLYSRQLARGDAQPSNLPDEKKALQPVDCRAFLKMVANQGYTSPQRSKPLFTRVCQFRGLAGVTVKSGHLA